MLTAGLLLVSHQHNIFFCYYLKNLPKATKATRSPSMASTHRRKLQDQVGGCNYEDGNKRLRVYLASPPESDTSVRISIYQLTDTSECTKRISVYVRLNAYISLHQSSTNSDYTYITAVCLR